MNQLPMKVTHYLCRKCGVTHRVLGKRGQAHLVYAYPLGPGAYFEKATP